MEQEIEKKLQFLDILDCKLTKLNMPSFQGFLLDFEKMVY